MQDWKNDPAYSEENLLANPALLGNSGETLSPRDEADDMVAQSGFASAMQWSQHYYHEAIDQSDSELASYWADVIACVVEIEQQGQMPFYGSCARCS